MGVEHFDPSVTAALVVSNLTPVVVTSASWTDEEWDHGEVGTIACADDGTGSTFTTRGAGRLLGGELLSTNLVTLEGTATNDGKQPPVTLQNDLDVSLLDEVLVLEGVLDKALSSLLTLTPPAEQGAGVLNQYASAANTGVSEGASGVVSNSGVILDPESENLPDLGTLKLSALVEDLTNESISGIVAGIADLELEIGAVASRATLDACESAWTGEPRLTREYAIAGLDAAVDALDLVQDLKSTLTDELTPLVRTLEETLSDLTGADGVLPGITGAVGTLLDELNNPLLSVGLGALSVDVDLMAAVNPLLSAVIQDEAGTVSIDLDNGNVHVNLAALLGAAYGGNGFDGEPGLGLNDLPPNTELVINDKVIAALGTALTDAIDGWVDDVKAALEQAILGAQVSASVSVKLAVLLDVSVKFDGTLQQLLAGEVVGVCTSGALSCLVGGLLNSLLKGLGAGIGQVLNDLVLGEGGLVSSLVTSLTTSATTALDPLGQALKSLLGVNGVFGVEGLVSLRVNVQNDPALEPDSPPAYDEWETGSRAVPDGQYDVAALSVSVLDVGGTDGNINLELARSSVGANRVVDTKSNDSSPDY